METIGGFIMDVLKSKGDEAVIGRVKEAVLSLTARFPLP